MRANDPVNENKSTETRKSKPKAAPGRMKRTKSSQHQAFWNAGMLLGLGWLVYNLLALWYRWLRPDPDFLAFTASVAELLAIASFIGFQTERGRDIADRVDNVLPLHLFWGTARRAFFTSWTAAVLTGLLLFVGSPIAAQMYRERGAADLERGAYSDAVRAFQQAISLDADEARAHFNLASAYETLHEEEKAISEYQLALELEHDFWPTYNNLGRLYIEARNRPDAALEILLSGQRQTETQLGSAVLGKNTAWAYWKAGYPRTALMELQNAEILLGEIWAEGEAVEIYLAEASRIKALVFEELTDAPNAFSAWQDCLGFSLTVAESAACTTPGIQPPPDCLEAQQLAAEAREKILLYQGDEG